MISNGVKSIGERAFAYCSSITSITIPNSVTSIGGSAFYGCSNLTSIIIGSGVTSIGGSAFERCPCLSSMVVENGNTTYDSRDNCNAIVETNSNTLIFGCQKTTIPTSVTGIGERAFAYCIYLTSIEIPNSVTRIGNSAFDGCTGLTSVTIPNSVTSIGSSAFIECFGLTSVTIPNSVTSIGGSAFERCIGLTSIIIGTGVTSIGGSAFERCFGLSSIVVEKGNTTYDSRDNCNAIIETNSNTLIFGCQKTTIPTSVTGIGERAFANCTGLTNVTIPNSVTSISGSAFSGCTGLTSVTIPNSVTSIGEKAFYDCRYLRAVTIPSSVTSIGERAFAYCNSLTSVTNYAPTPQNIVNTVFYNPSACTLYVPEESIDLYKAADVWKDFSHIEAIQVWHKIVFADWDGSTILTDSILNKKAATPPTNPTREGYTFIGWDKDFSSVTEDMVVTAQYKINRYYVQFLDWDNSVLKADSVDWNTAATAPANPTREWYTFKGWNKEFGNITSDIVVTAQYDEGQVRDYTLLFTQSTDGSEISNEQISFKIPTPPTIAGFTFVKWVIVASDLDETIEIQATYKYEGGATEAPAEVVNPKNPAQKLIRNGNVYILTGEKAYTIIGQEVK